MSKVTVRVHGKADFARNQQAYLAKTIAQANRGLDSITEIAKGEMEANCPVDTGLLRDSHAIMSDIEGKYRYIRYLYNDMYYARFVHEGTMYMEARPWMLNGFYATRSRMLPEMLRA